MIALILITLITISPITTTTTIFITTCCPRHLPTHNSPKLEHTARILPLHCTSHAEISTSFKLLSFSSRLLRLTAIATLSMSASARHAPHVTRHTSHVTRHTSHVTRHTSHVTRHLPKALQGPLNSGAASKAATTDGSALPAAARCCLLQPSACLLRRAAAAAA